MICPKCASENVQASVVKGKKRNLLIGIPLIILGATNLFGLFGFLAAIIVSIVAIVAAPKHEAICICQGCGFVFDPKTGKEKKL